MYGVFMFVSLAKIMQFWRWGFGFLLFIHLVFFIYVFFVYENSIVEMGFWIPILRWVFTFEHVDQYVILTIFLFSLCVCVCVFLQRFAI